MLSTKYFLKLDGHELIEDIKYCLKLQLCWHPLFILVFDKIIPFRIEFGQLPSLSDAIIQFISVSFVFEFLAYMIHLAYHKIDILRSIHQIHHQLPENYLSIHGSIITPMEFITHTLLYNICKYI